MTVMCTARPMVQAELLETYPAACGVCRFEHNKIVESKNARQGRRHRKLAHPWLHAILVANGLAKP